MVPVTLLCLAGVIINPLTGETFTATAGGGAMCDGEPIHVSETAALADAVVASGFGMQNTPQLVDENVANFGRFVNHIGGFRRFGSAALDMCMVARGVVDLYFERGVKAWDVCAGTVIVREAGGVCVDPYGVAPCGLLIDRVLCGPASLCEGLSSLLETPADLAAP